MIKRKLKRLILIIKILLRIPGYEWFSPAVREFLEAHPEMMKDIEPITVKPFDKYWHEQLRSELNDVWIEATKQKGQSDERMEM